MTLLREFHRTSGNNSQRVKVGDVVLIQDEGPRVNWKLAVIRNLIKGGDGLVQTADSNKHRKNKQADYETIPA